MTTSLVPANLKVRLDVQYPKTDTSGADLSKVQAVITEEVGKHTLFNLTQAGAFSYFEDALRSGTPFRVAVSSESHGTTFWYGYVDSVLPINMTESTKSTTEAEAALTEIVGAGLTYPLKTASQKTWDAHTYDAVVKEIVDGIGLVPFTDYVDRNQPIAQAGQSGWQLINHLANLTGRLVFTTGSTVNWVRPETIFEQFRSSAPRLRYRTKDATPLDLVSFDQRSSDNNAHESNAWKTRSVAAGVDPVSAAVSTASSGTGMFDQFMEETARSSMSVESLVAGTESAFPTTAEISGPGNPLVAAGRPVYVTVGSVGSWWLVKKVIHTLSGPDNTHTMRALLMRSSSFPTDPPPKFPKVNTNRKLPGRCLCKEDTPFLEITSRPVVNGTGSWGELPRWKAQGNCQ